MPTNRAVITGGEWAIGAADAPAEPIAGATYRNSALTEAAIQSAWPFSEVVGSAKFNEVMGRVTSLLVLLESWGILPYSALTDYAIGARVMGSDGIIYEALAANGPATTVVDAVGNPATWIKSGYTEAEIRALSASTTQKGVVELATDAEAQTGTDTSRAVTPAALASVTATTTRRGLIEIATDAEALAGLSEVLAVNPKQLAVAVESLQKNEAIVSFDLDGVINADVFSNCSLSNFEFNPNPGYYYAGSYTRVDITVSGFEDITLANTVVMGSSPLGGFNFEVINTTTVRAVFGTQSNNEDGGVNCFAVHIMQQVT
jgi:hypothetical protein